MTSDLPDLFHSALLQGFLHIPEVKGPGIKVDNVSASVMVNKVSSASKLKIGPDFFSGVRKDWCQEFGVSQGCHEDRCI